MVPMVARAALLIRRLMEFWCTTRILFARI
jgi:hypothetical protein